ncbi:hypothetical protein FF38_12203 [Lucilia cuprina]|uniref:Uncharacterized protein n=1 Tax=Lucilia cuprina TaxID=7375 RepID=A0A0L0BR70_LUCCU|nr:hypothetical protein FF38_12203 [Lucilia cuprina]
MYQRQVLLPSHSNKKLHFAYKEVAEKSLLVYFKVIQRNDLTWGRTREPHNLVLRVASCTQDLYWLVSWLNFLLDPSSVCCLNPKSRRAVERARFLCPDKKLRICGKKVAGRMLLVPVGFSDLKLINVRCRFYIDSIKGSLRDTYMVCIINYDPMSASAS